MATEQKESRLARWSRLKGEEAREEDAVKAAALAPAGEGGSGAEGALAEEDVPEIRAEDLPNIDSLDENSDFTPFMQKGVPEELSRLALRKLWKSNPVFANLDGLNDYDQDYSIIEAINAAVDTAYKVGKGLGSDDDVSEETGEDNAVGEGEDDGPADAPRAASDEALSAENQGTEDLSTTDEDALARANRTPESDTSG